GTDRLPIWLRRRVRKAVEATSHNTGILVNLAFNYGGRDEILDAVKQMLADGLKPSDVTASALEARLTTAGLPDVDLLVRTGGEQRVSNFLVWQSTYAEYHFTEKYWPEFDTDEVDAALVEFARRQRRFGLVEADEDSNGT